MATRIEGPGGRKHEQTDRKLDDLDLSSLFINCRRLKKKNYTKSHGAVGSWKMSRVNLNL